MRPARIRGNSTTGCGNGSRGALGASPKKPRASGISMFIGHFAVGFAAKRIAPRTNVALLIAAALFLDILWPIFVLLGWEQVRIDPGNTRYVPLAFTYYPWSHSLAMSMLWATAFALIYYMATRY